MTPTAFRSIFARSASVLATAALMFTTACSTDSVVAPQATPEFKTISLSLGGILQTLIPMAPLTRNAAVEAPITRSFTIGQNGGTMEIKETGLRVDVPAGAIPGSGSMTITITALPGRAVAYDFQPHGTQFRKALDFNQDLTNTSWNKPGFKGNLQGGYFAKTEQLNLMSGLALLNELLPLSITNRTASFDIRHFSGYMVSSGRQSASDSQEF